VTNASDDTPWTATAKVSVAFALLAWAGFAYWIGTSGLLDTEGPQPFRPVVLTAAVPVLVFLLAYRLLPRFRAFVLAQDIQTLTQIQLWRVVGFAFLLLYAHDILPALFAWPAGFGDVAVGLAAVFVVAGLRRDRRFVFSGRFAAFHVLGLLDFVGAVGGATLASGAFPALVGDGPTSLPMEAWPLNLFPSMLVPLFIILHLSVFLKLAALRRSKSRERRAILQAA